MERNIFEDEHKMFRETVRKFVQQEVMPHHEQWEKDRIVPREFWEKAGQYGFLGMDVPEEYGGGGVKDFRYNAISTEEFVSAGATGPGIALHNDIVLPYILEYGTDEQKARWLPKMVTGETITAIAMTEPGTGSDLANVRTTAIRDNGHYVVNGSKTFITNGINSDFVIAVVKTNPDKQNSRLSLLAIERGMEGFTRGRNLEKIGQKAQDTAEMFFDNVKVPVENMIGDEGKGFMYLMQQLPQERLAIAVAALAGSSGALKRTIQYCKGREAFGKPISRFQNSRFKFAEMKTEVTIGQVFVDRCITALNKGELTADEAAMAKWWTTDMQQRVIDQCLQLHGGYGYMLEYPIAKAWMDARVLPIYGGTNEIMKEIISRMMGL